MHPKRLTDSSLRIQEAPLLVDSTRIKVNGFDLNQSIFNFVSILGFLGGLFGGKQNSSGYGGGGYPPQQQYYQPPPQQFQPPPKKHGGIGWGGVALGGE